LFDLEEVDVVGGVDTEPSVASFAGATFANHDFSVLQKYLLAF
jgi:hypothetical protein